MRYLEHGQDQGHNRPEAGQSDCTQRAKQVYAVMLRKRVLVTILLLLDIHASHLSIESIQLPKGSDVVMPRRCTTP